MRAGSAVDFNAIVFSAGLEKLEFKLGAELAEGLKCSSQEIYVYSFDGVEIAIVDGVGFSNPG